MQAVVASDPLAGEGRLLREESNQYDMWFKVADRKSVV